MEGIESYLMAIREDLSEIRSLLRDLNGRVRESEQGIARLEEGQRRQDEEIRHLRARDWAMGLIASMVAAAMAAMGHLFHR